MYITCSCRIHLLQDTDIFGKLLDDDVAAAKTPVAVIAFAGITDCI